MKSTAFWPNFFAAFVQLTPWVQISIAIAMGAAFISVAVSLSHLLRSLLVHLSIRRLSRPIKLEATFPESDRG